MADCIVSREGIEKTILEQLRLWLVAAGYLPDVNAFLPATPANKVAYQAAVTAIIATGKKIIEPFGLSSNENRGEKRMHKIIINLRSFTNGRIGQFGDVVEPTANPNEFQRSRLFTYSKTLIYDIRIITESVEYDRLLTQAIMESITSSGVGRPLYPIKADGSGYDMEHFFWIKFLSSTDVKTPPYFERLYTFEIKDVWIDDWGVAPYVVSIPVIQKIEGFGTKEGEEILIFEVEQ